MIGRFHCDEPIADFRWCSGRTNQRGTNWSRASRGHPG